MAAKSRSSLSDDDDMKFIFRYFPVFAGWFGLVFLAVGFVLVIIGEELWFAPAIAGAASTLYGGVVFIMRRRQRK